MCQTLPKNKRIENIIDEKSQFFLSMSNKNTNMF